MDKEQIRTVLDEMETLVEEGKGPQPYQINRWIDLLKIGLKEGGD